MNLLSAGNHVRRRRLSVCRGVEMPWLSLWPCWSADRAPDLFADLVKHQTSLRQDGAHGLEVMDHAVVTGVFDRNSGRDQFCCIGVALVAHRVELGGMDNGGR